MSTSTITLQPATSAPLARVAGLLSEAFADYVAPAGPAAFSPRTLEATVARDDILLDQSYVAVVDGAPAGVALVAVRHARGGPRTRLAGMGVVPLARRAGVARALLARVVADARGRGSPTIVLEAFERNVAAVRLYEGNGFIVARRLLGFALPLASPPAHDAHDAHDAHAAPAAPAVTLHPAGAPELLPLFSLCASAEAPEAAPPWQVEAVSLARLGPSAPVYVMTERGSARPAGYVALTGAGPVARLAGLGVAPAWRRRGLATAALAALREARPDVTELSVAALTPERSALTPFLAARGVTQANEAQLEMVRYL